jgi:hypothetical protein
MSSVDWPALILKLRGPPQRLTLKEIAHFVGVHHATIIRLQNGVTRCAPYDVGAKLIALEARGRQLAQVGTDIS